MTLRRTIPAILLLACFSTVMAVILGENPRNLPVDRPNDFFQLYLVSWNLRHDRPVYGDIATPPEMAQELGWSHSETYSFANPPGLVPFLAPLSLLPYNAAWWSLFWFSVVGGLVAFYWSAREMAIGKGVSAMLAGFFVCSLPFLVLLVLNHFESLVLLLGTGGWVAFRKGRMRSGGILWGLCAAFKLFPSLWILPLFFRSHLRRGGGWAVGTALATTSLGWWVLGSEKAAHFIAEVLPQAHLFVGSPGNLSLFAVGDLLGVPWMGWLFAVGTGVLTCMVLFRSRTSIDQLWVSCLAASLLMSPLSWSYYFVLLGPALVVLASHLDWARASQRALVYGLVISLFLWPSLLANWGTGVLPSLESPIGIAFNFVPTLGLIVLLSSGLFLMKAPRPPSETSVPS